MARIALTQESFFSEKLIEFDTNDISHIELSNAFFGNYKVILHMKNGSSIKIATSYYDQVEYLFSLIKRAQLEEAERRNKG